MSTAILFTTNASLLTPLLSPISLFSSPFPPPLSPKPSLKPSLKNHKNAPFFIQSLVVETVEGGTAPDTPLKSRRLILLRHADSTWADRSLRDHDRPLSEAGRTDAGNISRQLQQMGWVPELILCSDATRTKETLQIMQEHARGFLEAEVHFVASFYSVAAMDGQTAEHLQQIICEYSRDELLTVMCMGHNRGWEEAASVFSGVTVELKTCNAALLEATGASWDEAFSSSGLGGWKLHGIVKPEIAL